MESNKKPRIVLLVGAPCSLARRRLVYSLQHHRNTENASFFVTSAAKLEDLESLKAEWDDACTTEKAQPFVCSTTLKLEELKSLGLSKEQIRIVYFWSEEDTCYKASLLDKTPPETYTEAWQDYIEWAKEFLEQLRTDTQLFSRVWFADSSEDDFELQTEIINYIMEDVESKMRPNPTTSMTRVIQTLMPERRRNKGEAISVLQQSKKLLDKRSEALLKQTINVLSNGTSEDQERMLHLFYGVIAGAASWREERTAMQRVILMRKTYWREHYLKYCQIFCLIAIEWTKQFIGKPNSASKDIADVAERFSTMLDMIAKDQSDVKEYLLCGLCRIIKRAHHLYFAPEMFETDEFWRLSQMLLSTNSIMLRTYGCSLASGALRDDHLRYSYRVIEFEKSLSQKGETWSFVQAIRDTIFSTMEPLEAITPNSEGDYETAETYLSMFADRDVALVLHLLIDGVPDLCLGLSNDDIKKLMRYAALANKYYPSFAGNIYGSIDAILKWGIKAVVADLDLRSLLEDVSSCINAIIKEDPNSRVLRIVVSLFNQVLKLTQRSQIFGIRDKSEDEDSEDESEENTSDTSKLKEQDTGNDERMQIEARSKLVNLIQSWKVLEDRWKKPSSARDFMSVKSLNEVFKNELDKLSKEEVTLQLAEQKQQNTELAEQLEKMTKLKEAADAEKAQLQAELARLRAELVKPQLNSSSEVVKVSSTSTESPQVEEQNQERDPLLDVTDPSEVSHEAAVQFINNLKQKRDSLKTLRKTICGSLRQLGPDLYSLSSHFINELIQNADDNQYSLGSTPSVLITLNEDSVLFACNENGFLARDVESLCNLSVSTKTGGAHIGQKGLGFKSVFSVTNAPIIVSGPWQFCFNKTPDRDEMAYITPLWLTPDQFPLELSQTIFKHQQDYRTFIYLPLMKRVQTNIREFYDDIYRSLDKHVLLTLKQLKKITIIDRLSAQQTVVSCTVPSNCVSLPAGDLTVQHYQQDLHVATGVDLALQTTSQHFHVLKADVHVPSDIVAEDKQRTADTTVMLAFPHMTDMQEVDTLPIFAYLPVSDIGFKFLLQCDWILVTNRESIQDKAWNRYLRDKAAELLKWALLNHPSIYAHAWEFIPEHNPAMSRWWSLFVDNVHAVLKDERLKKLLSSDSSGPNKKEIVMPDNKVLDVVSADLIEKYSSVQLLDSAQLNSEKIKLISSYVRRLSVVDVLDCFEHGAFSDYIRNQPDLWWENLFKLFNSLSLATIDKSLTKITQAPIFLFDTMRRPKHDQHCFVAPASQAIKPWRGEFNFVSYASTSEKQFLEGQLRLTALVPHRVVDLISNIHLQSAVNKTTQEKHLLWHDLIYIRNHLTELPEDLVKKLKSVLLVPSSTQSSSLLSSLAVPTLLSTDVSKHVTPSIAYPYSGKFQSLEDDMHWEAFFLEMDAMPPVTLISTKPAPDLEISPLANWSERAASYGQKILTRYAGDTSMTALIRNMLVKLTDGSKLPISKVANANEFGDALPSIEVPLHTNKVADMLGVCSKVSAKTSLEILTAFARTNNTNVEKYTEWLWRLKSTLGSEKVDAAYASQPLIYLEDDKRFVAPQDIYLCNTDNNPAVNIVCKTLGKSLVNISANNTYLPFGSLLKTLGGYSFPPISDIATTLNEMAKNPKYFLPVGSDMSLLSNDGLEDFIATYQLLEMALKRAELAMKGPVGVVEPDNPLHLHNWTWRNLHRLPGVVSGSLPIPLHSKRLAHLKDTKNVRACLQDPVIKSVSNVDSVPFVHPTIAINCPRTLTALQVPYIEQLSVIALGHTGANIEYKLQQISEAFQRTLGKEDITVLSVKYIPCSIVYSHLRRLSTRGVIDGNDVISVMIKTDIPYLICNDTLVYCAVKMLPHSSRMSIISSALTNMLLRKNVTWTEEEAQKHAFKVLKDCTADSNVAWSKSLSSDLEEFDTELVVFPPPTEGSLSQNFHYFTDNQRAEHDSGNNNQIVSFDDVLGPLAISDPAMIERVKLLDARSDLFSCPHLTTDERPYMFTPQDAKRIGDDAEKFFCAYLANKYGQAFNPYVSWVSGSRTQVYPNSTSNINEKAGYDFVLIDTLYLFSQDRAQNKKAKKCYFEVKGFSKEWNGQIEISDNQLKVRKRIAEVERDTGIYFVAIVYHVDSPELTNVFVIDWSDEDTFEASPVKYLATYNPPSNNTRHERREQQDRGNRTNYNQSNSGYNPRQSYHPNSNTNTQHYTRDRNQHQPRFGNNTVEQAPQQYQYHEYNAQYYSLPPQVPNQTYTAQTSYYNPNFQPQYNLQPSFSAHNYGSPAQPPQPVQHTAQNLPPRGQRNNNNRGRGNNEGQRNNNDQANKRQKTFHPK